MNVNSYDYGYQVIFAISKTSDQENRVIGQCQKIIGVNFILKVVDGIFQTC